MSALKFKAWQPPKPKPRRTAAPTSTNPQPHMNFLQMPSIHSNIDPRVGNEALNRHQTQSVQRSLGGGSTVQTPLEQDAGAFSHGKPSSDDPARISSQPSEFLGNTGGTNLDDSIISICQAAASTEQPSACYDINNTVDMSSFEDCDKNYSSPDYANPDDLTWSHVTPASSLDCTNGLENAEARSPVAKLSADTPITPFSEGSCPRLCQKPLAPHPGNGAPTPNANASKPVLNDISRPRKRSHDNLPRRGLAKCSEALVLSPGQTGNYIEDIEIHTRAESFVASQTISSPITAKATPRRSLRLLPSQMRVGNLDGSFPGNVPNQANQLSGARKRLAESPPVNQPIGKRLASGLSRHDRTNQRTPISEGVADIKRVRSREVYSRDQQHKNLRESIRSSGRPGHEVRSPRKHISPTVTVPEPLTTSCGTCGFSAGHILELCNSVEALNNKENSMPIMQLFLGFIRSHATQRLAQGGQAAYNNRYHTGVARSPSIVTFMTPVPENSMRHGNIETVESDSDAESQAGSSDSILDESAGSGEEDDTEIKRSRWTELEELQLRGWVAEEKRWPWIAKKLHRSEGAVSQHWAIMSKKED
ncbi:hypothetical protein F4778DRAFT_102149 [Xylariomycetidae sp. FL2044]|nr:hypothetical protein F4778DRAFT_102149 [Xylariomycetidae sp. FL2044]